MNNTIVNGLWIGGALSPLEILTIKSFQANGYDFQLWHYHELKNVPPQTILRDASEIVAEQSVFSYNKVNKYGHGKGSFAGFSDIFRYKLLYENGGIWVDMDVTCIQPISFKDQYIFRYHHKSEVVGNYLQCPAKSELMKWCYEKATKTMSADNEDWMLPIRILNEGIKKYNLEKHIQSFSNEDSFPLVSQLIRYKKPLPKDWQIIHWMNEEFRRLNIDKNEVIEGSWLHHFLKLYDIETTILSGSKKSRYFIKLSRLHYIYVSLIARVKYIFQ